MSTTAEPQTSSFSTTDGSAGRGELRRACAQALPLWSQQVQIVRGQTETAIVSLSRRFGGLCERLEASVKAARAAGGGEGVSVVDVFDHSERQLRTLLTVLEKSLSGKAEMARKFATLAGFAADLRGMAQEVADVAMQTNLLAINASIESAQAGAAGRGFAVVASEVRKLSNHSKDASLRIEERVEQIRDAMNAAMEAAERAAREDREVVRHGATLIEETLSRMKEVAGGLSQSSEILLRESAGIRSEIADILVSLQFQDRVSQILTAVYRGIDQLHQKLLERTSDDDASELQLAQEIRDMVTAMQSLYTTDEQRAIHSGAEVAESSGEDLTFF